MKYVYNVPKVVSACESSRKFVYMLRNVSQSIFLQKKIALLRKVVGESACYTSIYVFDTKRRSTRFKVRKALNNKFVCVFIMHLSMLSPRGGTPGICGAFDFSEDFLVKVPTVGPQNWVK